MATDPIWAVALIALLIGVAVSIAFDFWWAGRKAKVRRDFANNCIKKEVVTRPKEKTWQDGEWL